MHLFLFACAGQAALSIGVTHYIRAGCLCMVALLILFNSRSRKPSYLCCPHPHLHSNSPALRKGQEVGLYPITAAPSAHVVASLVHALLPHSPWRGLQGADWVAKADIKVLRPYPPSCYTPVTLNKMGVVC